MKAEKINRTRRFQFLMVRLKVAQDEVYVYEGCLFQFLMVRLKGVKKKDYFKIAK